MRDFCVSEILESRRSTNLQEFLFLVRTVLLELLSPYKKLNAIRGIWGRISHCLVSKVHGVLSLESARFSEPNASYDSNDLNVQYDTLCIKKIRICTSTEKNTILSPVSNDCVDSYHTMACFTVRCYLFLPMFWHPNTVQLHRWS